ncbi:MULTISPECIES: SgcJ/EcaC family oxidoreductase [unclassified Streptomyces]|uniref:SgcJ/EcaC family oxidoreductase n=1 Tax=unclassified Streptomyces TaxID=2593676 RepID=UPI00380ACBE2
MKRRFTTRTALVASTAVLAAAGVAAATTTASAAPEHRPSPASVEKHYAGKSSKSALPTKAEIARLFDRWNAALATGDAEKVAELYAPGAVLLPTVSPKMRANNTEIVDYFEHFLPNKPVGTKDRTSINVMDKDSAVDTGLYHFILTGKDGEKKRVDARYTFVYEKIKGKWLIINHHSSALPAAG